MQNYCGESVRNEGVNLLDFDINVSEFYDHFGTNTIEKDVNSLILPIMR